MADLDGLFLPRLRERIDNLLEVLPGVRTAFGLGMAAAAPEQEEDLVACDNPQPTAECVAGTVAVAAGRDSCPGVSRGLRVPRAPEPGQCENDGRRTGPTALPASS